jgi:signal transduction histidine kinase
MEYRLRRADGEYRWMLDRGVPRFSGGVFSGYVGSCIDITDMKRAQEEALARQKLESMGLMASSIAHDFNTLLGTILASAELAASERDGDGSYEDEIQRIKTTAIRGAELVRELMIYAGHENPEFEPVNLATLIDDMVNLLKVVVSKRLKLNIDVGEDLPAVRASSTQIRQVLMNLMLNASDAVGDQLGEIRISTRLARVRRDDHAVNGANLAEGEYVRLQVSDSGVGMTREVQARMFDPFYTTKQAGRGLGLAVVQGIVRSHGGAINVSSQPARGTTFEILLPCAAEEAKHERAAVASGRAQHA